jgi:polar amino acid transport system substrate-binding protein
MYVNKRTILVLIAMSVIAIIFTGCSGGQSDAGPKDTSLQDIKDKGEFVVGLDDSFPPMGFRDEKGQIVGFDIDLAKEVASRMGVEVVFKPVDWDGIAMSLVNKDIDVIWNGLTITEKRKENMAFTKPYLNNRQIVVVTEGSDIRTKADLEGKVVGLQMASSSEAALDSEKEVADKIKEIRKYSNNVEALLDLANGGNDAVVVDEVVGRYYIAKRPGEYRILDEYFTNEEYGVGYRKEDVSFGQELDRILDEMKADGTADEISIEWFGQPIVVK